MITGVETQIQQHGNMIFITFDSLKSTQRREGRVRAAYRVHLRQRGLEKKASYSTPSYVEIRRTALSDPAVSVRYRCQRETKTLISEMMSVWLGTNTLNKMSRRK